MRSGVDDFRLRTADDPASLLVVVLDVSASSWARLTGLQGEQAVTEAAAALESTAEQLLVSLNSFLLLHESNRCCVLLASPNGARQVYPIFQDPSELNDPAHEDSLVEASANKGLIQHELVASELREALIDGVKGALRDGPSAEAPSEVSTALAMALCLQNRGRRIKTESSGTGQKQDFEVYGVEQSNGRILAILAGHDAPDQYVPVMNCIFAAQRMGVAIDSCVLARNKDSTYFQQAAYLTNGVYLRPSKFSTARPDGLIQFFQTVFLVDKQSRDFLAMPTPDKVDFRASCMETRKTIEDGYTCSVCLSTFSMSVGKVAMCPVCSARFPVVPRAGRRVARPVP